MELKWLEDFVSIAELRNFSKTAVVRHTTQPALSRRIKALEIWYGVPLVDRSTYPVNLTPAGLAFLPLAQHMVTDLYRSRRQARAEVGISGRTVTFAMPHSLAVHFFPAWWRRQKHHSDAKASVVAVDLDDCVELLLTGACQFVLCYRHETVSNGLDEQPLHRTLIGRDRLVPVSATDGARQPLFQLSGESGGVVPLLAYSKASFLGRVTASAHTKLEATWTPSFRYESALVEALKAEVLVGEGIAWLPEQIVKNELDAGLLTVVGDPDLAIPLEIWLFRPSPTSSQLTQTDLLAFELDDVARFKDGPASPTQAP